MAPLADKIFSKIRIRNDTVRKALAEFLGTFILIVLGNGAVAQVVLSEGLKDPSGTFLSINLGYGFAVAFGVYVSGGVSGGHINPAVSLAMCTLGKLSWSLLPVYAVSQYLGALAGSGVVYGVYLDALNAVDVNRTTPGTAGIWATYPKEYLTVSGGLFDQITGTALLLMLVLAVTDEKNIAPPKGIVPLLIGFIVTTIGLTYGYNCGYAINPARDLAPRLFTLIAGYGEDPFSYRDYEWFWIPILGPHIGAVLGAWLYMFLIGAHTADPEADYESNNAELQGFSNGAYADGKDKTDNAKF